MKKIFSGIGLWFLIFALHAQIPAFPGAQGFGKFAQGARANSTPSIYHVTHLNDSGTGSLRDAISQPNRIIVFDVSGIIRISSRLIFSSNLYVAGQTAPGDGISVYGNGVSFSAANNIIVRFMRFRMGIHGDSGKDAAGIANGTNMIFDHCSFNWGLDETFSINWDSKGSEPGNITIQNCIIGQGVMVHSAGGLIQTDGGVSLYRNLYTDNKTRNPKVKGLNQYVNNVVYNWGSGGGYILGDTEASSWGDIRNNYFIKGPSTGGTPAFSRATLWFQVLQEGNMLDYNQDGVLNGVPAVSNDYGPVTLVPTEADFTGIPVPHPQIEGVMSAEQAYNWILDSVGASLPSRDMVDDYLIRQLKSLGTQGTLINTEAELGLPNVVGDIFNGNKLADADNDGMPDQWENSHGLNMNSTADALQKDASGYLNIEMYIHSIKSSVPYVKYPTLLTVKQIDETFAVFRWSNNEPDADSIIVEYSQDNTHFQTHTKLAATVVEFRAENLSKSSTYYFRLKTYKGGIASLNTNSLKITTIGADAPPAACTEPIPANEALVPEFNQVTLRWSNPSSLTSTLYYNLWIGTTPDGMVQKTAGTTSSTFNLSIVPGATYYWRVDAMNILGIQTGELWSFTTGYRPPREKVAYFPLDEDSGNSALNEVEGNAGALNFTPTWIKGQVNNAVSLPGSPANAALVQSHYDGISLGNESFTVEFWFRSNGGSVDWYLIHKGSFAYNATSGSTGKWFGVQYNKIGSNDRLTWAYDDNVNKTDLNISTGSRYFDGLWHHFVAMRDVEQGQSRIYMDGKLANSRTNNNTGNISNTENLVLGNINDPNAPPANAFLGALDEVSIYKGVMTDAEILDSYQTGLTSHLNHMIPFGSLSILPNPVKDQAVLTSDKLVNDKCLVEIYDLSGKLIRSEILTVESNQIKLNGLSHLAQGIYTIVLVQNSISLRVKMIQ